MNLRLTSEKAKDRICVLVGTLISCFFSFYNQFPLVYEDTGTYIHSGFAGEVPIDRPLLYGLFIRHISMSNSLWYVVYVQGFILSFLLLQTTSLFFEGARKRLVVLTLLVLLTVFTGYSYYVSLLIPDIFAAAFFLAVFNLLFLQGQGTASRLFTACIIVFSAGTQFSLRVIFILLLVFLLVYALYKWRRKEAWLPALKHTALLAMLLTASGLLTWIIGKNYKNEHKQVNATYIFMMSHFNEVGILKDYLNTNCEKKQYNLCHLKDSLTWDFMWDPRSPLYRLGGWGANNAEYGEIVWEVCTKPKYQKLLLQRSVEHMLAQCFIFNVEPSAPQREKSPPMGQIQWRFPEQLRDYINSRQYNSRLDVGFVNAMQSGVVLLSLVLLFTLATTRKLAVKFQSMQLQILLLVAFCVSNAWICSTFSTVIHRFQGRIVWLLPAFAFLYAAKLVSDRFFEKKNSGESSTDDQK